MTRTNRTSVLWGLTTCLLLAALSVGCGPDAKDKKIQELSAENDRLRGDLSDRERQLQDALAQASDSQATIDDLNRELAKLRAQGGGIKEGEWITTPTFDLMSISDSVLFNSGKADLLPTGRTKLAQVAADIRAKYSDRDIYVFGHTDAQPIRKSKWKDNWELGAQRALTVLRALNEAGVSNSQLVAATAGEYRPVVIDAVNKNQPQNRRVEIFAVRRGGSTR